mmetsp:Transcript_13300/g.30431  ORF Transcript_13300/g.30431 Transcript_13300/m.30431 type:complete len:178 (-) Transcript_13300:147-680(-)
MASAAHLVTTPTRVMLLSPMLLVRVPARGTAIRRRAPLAFGFGRIRRQTQGITVAAAASEVCSYALEEADEGTEAILEEFQALSASYKALVSNIDSAIVKRKHEQTSAPFSLSRAMMAENKDDNNDHVVGQLVDTIATLEATLAERDNELVEAGRKLEVLENELMNLRARLQTEVVT